jgi:uncharacterized protein (DUF2062 family)
MRQQDGCNVVTTIQVGVIAKGCTLIEVITKVDSNRHSWIRRKLVSPVVRMLRHGASPQRLAWSISAGLVIGMNPIIGSTTVTTIAVTHLLKLNHGGSQIGVHSAYPLQIALLLPFIHAGAVLFGTDPLPLDKNEMLSLIHEHPLQLLQSLWMWEWHALVVWLGFAVVITPALALLLRRVLERALKHPRLTPAVHADAV